MDGGNLLPVLTGEGEQPARNPMIWIFPEYGSQLAIRMGDFKIVRCRLSRDRPGPWEIYDLNSDPAERNNAASAHSALLEQTRRILGEQWADNEIFGPKRETALAP